MKRISFCFLALLLLSGGCSKTSNPSSSSAEPKLPANLPPQMEFELTENFLRPVDLPAGVLGILQKDEKNRKAFAACPSRGGLNEIPAEWFSASEAELKAGDPPALIVKGKNGCLWEEAMGPFWVFLPSQQGLQPAFKMPALSLELLETRTEGYRDLRVTTAASLEVHEAMYKFQGGKYQESKNAPREKRGFVPTEEPPNNAQ